MSNTTADVLTYGGFITTTEAPEPTDDILTLIRWNYADTRAVNLIAGIDMGPMRLVSQARGDEFVHGWTARGLDVCSTRTDPLFLAKAALRQVFLAEASV